MYISKFGLIALIAFSSVDPAPRLAFARLNDKKKDPAPRLLRTSYSEVYKIARAKNQHTGQTIN